jgi:unsaturated rhamnogalacturonyl hydrolase
MKRRTFLLRSTVGLSAMPGLASAQGATDTRREIDDSSTLEKVKLAMLSMQRASWEQGVAMQAFLELGDHDIAYVTL